MTKDEPRHPIGGIDYPRTLQEFDEWFLSEAACIGFLHRVRWCKGFECPDCRGTSAWVTARNHLRCTKCQRQTSVTAGTIFDSTRKPLRMWFQAMWYLTSQKSGGSALGLQCVLGLRSYQTAWSWLHKLRRAMVRPGPEQLKGCVEVDETYLGGKEQGVHGRETQNKAIVVVAAEEDGRGIGRIRLRRVPDVSAASLHSFIEDSVTRGSEVHTDGWKGYLQEGLLPQSHSSQPKQRACTQTDASCAPSGLALETMGPWDVSRSRQRKAFGLLPRRVYVPLQPSAFTSTGATVLSPRRERYSDQFSPVSATRRRRQRGRTQYIGGTRGKWIPHLRNSLTHPSRHIHPVWRVTQSSIPLPPTKPKPYPLENDSHSPP